MRRLLVSGLAAAGLVVAPAAGAAVRLGEESSVHALAAVPGAALAVVDSGDRSAPFSLVRSGGALASDLGTFGDSGAEFPDVATSGARALVSWGVPISGGASVRVVPAPVTSSGSFGEVAGEVVSTGPGRLAAGPQAATLAYPDRAGDIALATLSADGRSSAGPPRALTRSAPELRHLPLDFVDTADGTYVLDVVQSRERTELRVVGAGAPGAPVLTVGGLREPAARLAAAEGVVAVAYLSRGRAVLAVSRDGREWVRRRLPGLGGGAGSPAPVIVGGDVLVAYTQRVRDRGARAQREVFLSGPDGTERLTRTPGDERDAHAAVGPDDRAYAAWTREDGRPRERTALLQRIG